MKIIDTHSHLNFAVFEADRDSVLERMRKENVFCVNVGTKKETSSKSVELAKNSDQMFSIVGLHPVHTNKCFHDEDEIGPETRPFNSSGEVFDKDFYRELTKNQKVIGIGECGLDYFRLPEDEGEREIFINKQKKAFCDQIELAVEVDLPIMIHCREAYGDVLDILKTYKEQYGEKLRGNCHFFAGNIEEAKEFLDLDFDLSFTGVITFAKQYRELVKFVPLDRIHVETDSPYVAPVPHRGERNEPSFVVEVFRKVAEIKGVEESELATQLIKNFERLYQVSL